MMLRKLRAYLWWKGKMAEKKSDGKSPSVMPSGNAVGKNIFDAMYADQEVSEALKKKDKEKAQRAQSRRRIRGGAPAASGSRPEENTSQSKEKRLSNTNQTDGDEFAQL